MATGYRTSGESSGTNDKNTTTGNSAHAEGYNTKALGDTSHAEGSGCEASGHMAHAEGYKALASGAASHAEGFTTIAAEEAAHAEGLYARANGLAAHAEGQSTQATETASHAEGSNTLASGISAHAEGSNTIANSSAAHAEGTSTKATALAAHAEGYASEATALAAHAEGSTTQASGYASHTEGESSIANGTAAHAEGNFTRASGTAAHAEGNTTHANGNYSHAEGSYTEAAGYGAHVEGVRCKSGGFSTHAEGYFTDTGGLDGVHIMGKFGNPDTGLEGQYAWYLANGIDTKHPGLAAKLLGTDSSLYLDGHMSVAGSGIAEMYETIDGLEIKPGYFVTTEEDQIRTATEDDDFILGVTQGTAALIMNSGEFRWKSKFVTDPWGQMVFQKVPHLPLKDGYGKVISPERHELQPLLDPDYDFRQTYIPRSKRTEWITVGLLGRLLVRDDGTCKPNGYCRPSKEGIATTVQHGYRVLKRISPSQILILFRDVSHLS
ncbi:hypothetical protein NV379_08895 [Paenibacillus sp. N1-5-1-14]|uniref:peptidase G2 autoproteolytic cleavage domain-containing protein n=1 Tax=Paenibacillus radicibacter TaxID=2972488 RepID=UPI002158F8EB|nr:peptidase G2 autoproteolytic cleavage domain-containing protein [Paenibacillus radicibacter]MCR8642778.1 hypothetical protein [Paenibacillus radicibacter]